MASVELPPGQWWTLVERLRSGAVVARLLVAATLVVALLVLTRGWSPPRDFYLQQIPVRDVVAPIDFQQLDEEATAEARDLARSLAEAIYDNDPVQLEQLKATLKNEVAQLVSAEDFASADRELWGGYVPERAEGTPEPTEEELQAQFDRFREAFSTEEAQADFSITVDRVFQPFESRGVLAKQPTDANAEQIQVRRAGSDSFERVVPVREVLIGAARDDLSAALSKELAELNVADNVFARLKDALPATLKLNREATRQNQKREASQVEPIFRPFERGALLAKAGEPLGDAEVERLELAYQARLAAESVSRRVFRGAGVFWVYCGLVALCGLSLLRVNPEAINDLPRYLVIVGFSLLAALAVVFAHGQTWRAELVPLLIYGMTIAIAYRHQSAMLLTAAVAAAAAIGSGQSLTDAVLMAAPPISAIAQLDTIRHRSKLLAVSAIAGLVAVTTTLAVAAIEGLPWMPSLKIALATGLWSIVAGSLMTCLLPLIEKVFRVQTDLSLIELGDPAHPLLQELVRRAPGTYNHSITVAALAESAAESIGARGLLVRVGAYFHDIGKMLKPGYFIENQAGGGNQHDTLVPAMSTLVIIAHVKDGADLARQNKLPEGIVDFILQHHGTTLVEYFYRQAQQKQDESGEGDDVDETSFRYPGPKPQTKEAGVLMLADAVESASRTLVEPTVGRIESLVEEIARKRLEDGQFDECGLTLEEVHKIGESLVKSLTAVYHGRVKYPSQVTA